MTPTVSSTASASITSKFSLTLLAGSSLTLMAPVAISPALPGMVTDQLTNQAGASMLITLPALAVVLGGPIVGYLCDKWGRKQVLLLSILAYAIGGSCGAWASSMAVLIAGRLALGLGVAGMMTSITALISDHYNEQERTRFFGLQAFAMGVGGVAMIMAGGALAELGWRIPFLLYLLAIPLLPAVCLNIHKNHRVIATETENVSQSSIKHYPAANNPAATNDSPAMVASLPTPGASTTHGLIISLLPVFAAAFYSIAIFFISPVQLPFLTEAKFAASPSQSALAISLGTFSGSLISLLYAPLKRRLSYTMIFNLSMALVGIAYLTIGLAPSMAIVYAGGLLSGFGSGLAMPNLNLWVSSLTAPHHRGQALGLLNTSINMGQLVSPIMVSGVIALSLSVDLYVLAGLFLICCNGAGFIGLLLRRNHPDAVPGTHS